jgi:hypothetical protein
MFKTKIHLVDEDWNLIYDYKSRIKPAVDEFIYVYPRYFKVLAVVHLIEIISNTKTLTVMVREWDNISKKD